MGVTGAGKTTVGRALAARLGWLFLDADDDHTPESVLKMHEGIPLTDADREPWLAAVGARVRTHLGRGENIVLACSALKDSYRQQLTATIGTMTVVFLTASAQTIRERLAERANHFMNSELLNSQLDALEPPADAIRIDVARTPEEIVEQIVRRIDTATGEILAPRR